MQKFDVKKELLKTMNKMKQEKLLRMEQAKKAVIVNKTTKCKGKWTWVNTGNEKEKAILDYVMTNENIYDDIIDMKIDEEKL